MHKNRDLSPAAMSTDESSMATDRPLPRAKSAIFPVDANANRLPVMSLGMLESALSSEGQICLPMAKNSTPNSASFSQIAAAGSGRLAPRPSIDAGSHRQHSQNDFLLLGGPTMSKSISSSSTHLPIHHHPHFASHSPHHHHQTAHFPAPPPPLSADRTFQFPSSGGIGGGQGGGPPPAAAATGGPHRRRSSIILNKRAPARHTESMELGERTGSKLTLDEELYDIIYAFLEVDRDKEEDEEAGVADPGGKPLTRQHLLNKIREKKEVINKLRCQAWNMNRKRRTLRLAQKYLEQNESKVSRTHLYKEELAKRWRQFLRWLGNIWIYFVPWESRIKRIESQFGSVVSSYFTFLRWVIFINFAITIVILAFIVVPECIADAMADPARQNRTAGRKRIPPELQPHADELAVGYLRFSPLFYGFYSNDPFISDAIRYPLPLAYFLATLFVFLFSLIVIPRRIARNARISKLSGTKAEQYVFNWKLFTGWDYSIGNAETATNAAMAAVIKLREAINESRSYARRACVPSLWAVRVITNAVILGMIVLSVYCIQAAMRSSTTVEKSSGSLFTKNQVPLLMSTITHIFPMIFDLIGRAEKHHARTALRLHLIRISALYIINYVTLMLSLFEKLDSIRDITRKEEEEEEGERVAVAEKWQWRIPGTGNTHPFRPQPDQPFLSRNFSKPHQWKQFFLGAFELGNRLNRRSATTLAQDDQSSSPLISTSTISAFTTKNGQRKKGTGRITVDGTSVTVHAQFGPVGVNNPSALMRNSTLPPLLESSPYETRRIGPTPLTVFTPPPLPPTQRVPTFKGQNFGPDWQEIQRERERERARKRPPTPAPTPANITVERPIHGLPYAKMETSSTAMPKTKMTTEAPESEEDDEEPPLPPPEMPMTSTSSTSTSTELGKSAQMGEDDEEEEDVEAMYDDQICWETMIGQEIVKLVTMDLYITIVSIFVIDFLRGIWIRYCSSWWCWDIETTFPEYGEFKVAENVLHICNNQGMVWLGLFFAPLLPAINSIKLVIIMYIRGWACTTCNVPAREIFRASRSSSFFLYILLSALLLCTIPVGYVITMKRPSVLCGPFAGQSHFYSIITDLVQGHVSKKVMRWLRYITSPGVIFPIILLLILFIFFLFSMVRGLRKANTDLQKQLIHERTEEKRKIFELAGGGSRKKGGGGGSSMPPSASSAAAVASAAAATHQHHLQQNQQQKGQRKVPSGQHLPEVERKRREPWRLFNNVNHKGDGRPSLCPSDEPPSSLNSPMSDESPTEAYAKLSTIGGGKQSSQRPTILDYSPSKTSGFRPSLGSLEEGNSLESRSHSSSDGPSDSPAHQPHPGQKMPFGLPHSQTQPMDFGGNVWERERRAASPNGSFSTPEEVRDLIAPYQSPPPPPPPPVPIDHHFPPPSQHHQFSVAIGPSSSSAVSLAGFPRDCPPLAILFGTTSQLTVSQQFAPGHRPSCHSPSMRAMAGSRAQSASPPSKSAEIAEEKERIGKRESANGGELLEEKLEEYDDIDKQSLYDELNSPKEIAKMERPKRLPLAAATIPNAILGRIVHQQQQQRSFSKIYRLRGAQPQMAAPLARPESSVSAGGQPKAPSPLLLPAEMPSTHLMVISAAKETPKIVGPTKATAPAISKGEGPSKVGTKSPRLLPAEMPSSQKMGISEAKEANKAQEGGREVGKKTTTHLGPAEMPSDKLTAKKSPKPVGSSKTAAFDVKMALDPSKSKQEFVPMGTSSGHSKEMPSLKEASKAMKSSLLPAGMPNTQLATEESKMIKSPKILPNVRKPKAKKEKLTSTTLGPEAMSRSDVFPGGTPSMEAPHRIALYSKEPRRIGNVGQQAQQQQERIRQLSASPSRTLTTGSGEKKRRKEKAEKEKEPRIVAVDTPSTSGTKTIPGKLTDQFVPWPSPDEIRKQRAQLLRPTGFGAGGRSNQPPPMQQQQMEQPLPIFTTGRARSPPKMIKSVHSSELTPPPEAPPRRFRITVSPTRGGPKLGISQEVEFQQPQDDPEKTPRRFVIKQQVFTGSTSTFGGSSASGLDRIGQLTAAGRKMNSAQQNQLHQQQQQQQYLQLQAPRVEFGEDDSPRVELPPSTSASMQQQQQRFHPSGGNFGRR